MVRVRWQASVLPPALLQGLLGTAAAAMLGLHRVDWEVVKLWSVQLSLLLLAVPLHERGHWWHDENGNSRRSG